MDLGATLLPMLPELFLMAGASLLLLIDIFSDFTCSKLTNILSFLLLIVCAVFSAYLFIHTENTFLFSGAFVLDPLASFLKFFSIVATGVVFFYSRNYLIKRKMIGENSQAELRGEFYVIALFALLGQMVVISAANLLTIYLGVELMSLALYALVALHRKNIIATEAAMKYFILGALASGFLLYGMSMLYGATGSLALSEIAGAIVSGKINSWALLFSIIFLVAGVGFKLGVAPFHMWVPDVYEGAPTPITLLIAITPKLAGFIICFRLLVEGLFSMINDWQNMLMILSVLSMIVGNITALLQTNVKRMLAYSSIAHMGFMLLGFLCAAGKASSAELINAFSSALFYVLTYVLGTLGALGVILFLARDLGEADTLDDFKGLNKKSPWLAFVMMLLMLSLAGVPPLVGFHGKLLVLQTLLVADHIVLAVVAVVLSVIGAFYYLRIIKLMYFDDPQDEQTISQPSGFRLVLGINGFLILILGLMPGGLITLCVQLITTSSASHILLGN